MDLNIFDIFNLLQLLPLLMFKLSCFWQGTSLSWILSPFDTTLVVFECLLRENGILRDHNLGANDTYYYWLIIFSRPLVWMELGNINLQILKHLKIYHCWYFQCFQFKFRTMCPATVSAFTPSENPRSQSHWECQKVHIITHLFYLTVHNSLRKITPTLQPTIWQLKSSLRSFQMLFVLRIYVTKNVLRIYVTKNVQSVITLWYKVTWNSYAISLALVFILFLICGNCFLKCKILGFFKLINFVLKLCKKCAK